MKIISSCRSRENAFSLRITSFYTIFPLIFFPLSVFGQSGIADKYIRDNGIGNDPDVIFSENYEGTLNSVLADWTAWGPNALSVFQDSPPASGGHQSVRVQPIGIDGTIYKRLPQDYEQVYVRYYIKYGGPVYSHTGGIIGGYSPPTDWPQGDAGIKGIRSNGDRMFAIEFGVSQSNTARFYSNWVDMQGIAFQGLYYGRDFVQDLNIPIPVNTWICVEIMLKMNSSPDVKDGELALWIDGQQLVHFRPGSPNGYWDIAGGWRMDSGSPAFEGFLWRDILSYGVNWFKLQNYNADFDVWFDDVVIATKYIGPISESSDTDADNDGVDDVDDNCPNVGNASQADFEDDGVGDACDADDDNDGVPDTADAFPLNKKETKDTDGDGMGDNFEARFSFDPQTPSDASLDSDSDGVTNLQEFRRGMNPRVNEGAVGEVINSILLD